MQRAVERDERSRPNYAMCTVNPKPRQQDEAVLCEVVGTTSNVRDCLLEVVNFEVEVRRQLLMLACG
jgi:hypothetical protein